MTDFKYRTKVELYDTDACGVIFFSHLFTFTHRAFSAFLEKNNISIQERFKKQDFFFPVVHVEGDYLAPIFCEDYLDIHVTVNEIGTSSFKMGYSLYKGETLAASAQVVHVAIDSNKLKVPLPESFRSVLEPYLLLKEELSIKKEIDN